jgi:predicted MPP superfamily phosphohydrolase
MNEPDLLSLRQRLGDDHLGRRLRAQVDRSLRIVGYGRGGLHFENFSPFMRTVALMLRATRLYGRAQRNALALSVRERPVAVRDLPPPFDGVRLLHLSDLHLDGYPGFGGRIAAEVRGQQFDLAVLTGDFRYHEAGRYRSTIEELAALVPVLGCRFGAYGILGNHDFVEMAPLIEQAGVRMLLNEAVALEADGARLWLVGLDDPHFYGLYDFEKALRGVPSTEPRLLLAHSPEIVSEAAARGFCLYLTGHTHGGQMCLPGGFAPYVNVHCARDQIVGAWHRDGMEGYTSAGVGASGVFGRFFCPPEIVIHRLVAGSQRAT